MGYALHCPQELWGMHCIAHRSYGVCTALPTGAMGYALHCPQELWGLHCIAHRSYGVCTALRSEEHTSELQSRLHLVCRLLLEKKKTQHKNTNTTLYKHAT